MLDLSRSAQPRDPKMRFASPPPPLTRIFSRTRAQIRNPHNYLADFQAELPLYERSGALVAFLDEHRRQAENTSLADVSLPERIEALSVAMYEYGIIGATDVELTQAWLEDLASIGYDLGKPPNP